ncbi:hypothetical protein AVEN_29960-1 [Araneus ventricosus]|uniref:Uncharacterized protein n=1 Tax=Araneus ventricosus TaxID=182803 RepID=A0A4Y2UEN2_ARAVE|nr:hypothetical protein AVEN_29960-1 [Araneus ventricosus]
MSLKYADQSLIYVAWSGERRVTKPTDTGSNLSRHSRSKLIFTGTSSCSAPTTIPQDPDGLPPTDPFPPTTASDHLIPRTEVIQHHQRTITRD